MLRSFRTADCHVCNLITRNMTRRDARTALHDAGYKWVGGGSFSSVWRSPDGSRVVKVTKPDAGSEATIRAAKRLPDNPHLPRIFGLVSLKSGGFAVEVEALQPVSFGVYGDFEDSNEWLAAYDGGLVTGNSDLAEALRALRKAKSNSDVFVDWDLHDENVMERDGEVVLTDLLYAPSAMVHAAGRGSSNGRQSIKRKAA